MDINTGSKFVLKNPKAWGKNYQRKDIKMLDYGH